MKKLIFLAAIVFWAAQLSAQSPDVFNYQAVARDAGGLILDSKSVSVRFTIHDVSPTGTVLYRESHAVLTNQFGLFTCQIGTGTLQTGTLANVNWTDSSKYLQVEFDPAGGTTYTDMGTSQFLSVPYAKLADAVNMFPSGVTNADKMVITHSPAYPTYGLQYEDVGDKFNFVSNNIPVLTVDISLKKAVGIGTSSPATPLDVRGSVTNSIDSVGLVTANNSTGLGNAITAVGRGTVSASGAAINGINRGGGTAVCGQTSGSGWAIYGYNPSGVAGHFVGDVETTTDMKATGFTQNGSGAPLIKTKKLTGTTAAGSAGNISIAHGLSLAKIISVNVLVEGVSATVMQGNTYLAGYHFLSWLNSSNVVVHNFAGESTNIYSSPVTVYVTYEQ